MWITFYLHSAYIQITFITWQEFQNSPSEHSFEGDPAILYNLTKSDPDPLPEVHFTENVNTHKLYVLTLNTQAAKEI